MQSALIQRTDRWSVDGMTLGAVGAHQRLSSKLVVQDDGQMEKVVLTYGTFDLFHIGHLRLLRRLRSHGDRLVVGVSTDEFNLLKGKQTIIGFRERSEIVNSVGCVDLVIPESTWDQKVSDINAHGVTIFGMGDDWIGKFDHLREHCEVIYLPRTEGISSTELKRSLRLLDRSHVSDLKKALDLIGSIVERFD